MLTVKSLDKSFGGIAALADVNFSLAAGEVLGIIGPNGSGKSTLINLISGFYRPTSGSITLDGVDLVGRGPSVIRKMGVGRTFQNLRLVESMSVLDNALAGVYLEQTSVRGGVLAAAASDVFGARSARHREELARATILEMLDLVGLGDLASTLAGNLSYADQKRLELARVLAIAPRVLILDEPTAGMAAEEADRLVRTVLDIVRGSAEPMSLLLIEHRLNLVLEVSDRTVVMDGGRVLVDGESSTIASNPDVRRIYLGGK